MLSVLGTILKIIGILFLAILGLLLSLVVLVLLVPVRYRAEAEYYDQNLKADVKITWLLHLISARGGYRDGKLVYRIRILGYPLFRSDKEKAPRKKRRRKSGRSQEEEADLPVLSEEAAIPPETEDTASWEVTPTGEVPSDAGEEPQKQTHSHRKRPGREKKEKKVKREEGRFASTREKLEDGLDFIQDPENQETFKFLKDNLLRLLRHVLPSVFRIKARIGMEDPALTGKILGAFYMFYPLYEDHIRVVGEFEEEVLEGELYLRGRIRMLSLLIIGWRLYSNKMLRKWIKR